MEQIPVIHALFSADSVIMILVNFVVHTTYLQEIKQKSNKN